uniref:palmitoyl-protein thioesterase 1 n=1 Tax=Erigeron canadensis TaxID=72917 RepID=UPI001CB91B3C|nr:palmitoyl-protein thioesterase 1 [Erigeron canadensis]
MASVADTLKTRLLFFIISTIILFPLITHSIPFVVFHGVADSCTKKGVTHFTDLLSEWSNAKGYCIEIGNGAWDSWFMPFEDQVDIACEKVKSMTELRQGYNIVGLSQGNLVGRGVIEFCDGAPPVKNFISVAGPHAGEASIPFCGSGVMCIMVDNLIKSAIYSNTIQEHLAPANYVKIPTDLDGYREGCKFLPKLNNEFKKNATYKERFSSLQNLVLIMFDKDTVLIPKETSWFGYYPDGAWEPILPPQETRLYIEDWIGLRTLDEAGRVKFINVTGGHLDMYDDDMKAYIVPYLADEETIKNPILAKSTREQLLPSTDTTNFSRKLGGEQDLQLNVLHR